MKKFLLTLVAAILMFGISQAQDKIAPAKAGVQYGKAIQNKNAVSVKELPSKINADSTYNGQIIGEVVEVCLKKGCFMKIKREDGGEPIMVRFKDYGFFMPEDIVGKTIVLEGQAKIKETSVAWLKHYAEDAGKSPEEIAKITQPKVDINIVADGVLVIK